MKTETRFLLLGEEERAEGSTLRETREVTKGPRSSQTRSGDGGGLRGLRVTGSASQGGPGQGQGQTAPEGSGEQGLGSAGR